jgi:hypothetical protein
MTQFDELGEQAKQALSWIALGELLNIKHLKATVGITHPGGGQYDCLNLFDQSANTMLAINRNGSSVLVSTPKSEIEIPNFWQTVSWNPRAAARLIAREFKKPDFSEPDEERMVLAFTVNRIGAWLLSHLHRSETARAEWGWSDSTYGAGMNSAIQEFKVPEPWRLLSPPFPHSMWEGDGWSAHTFILFNNGKPVALVNMSSGEAIDCDGEVWDRWPKLISRDEGESVALAFDISVTSQNGDLLSSTVALPNRLRYMRKIYAEEFLGAEINIEPKFELDTENYQELINLWRIAEGFELDLDGYLDSGN